MPGHRDPAHANGRAMSYPCPMRTRFRFSRPRCIALIGALALPALLLGCAQTRDALGYYWQSAHGHAQLMGAARPLDDWIAEPDTPPALRTRLQLLGNLIRRLQHRIQFNRTLCHQTGFCKAEDRQTERCYPSGLASGSKLDAADVPHRHAG